MRPYPTILKKSHRLSERHDPALLIETRQMGRAVRRCEKIGTDHHSELPAKVRRFPSTRCRSKTNDRGPMLPAEPAIKPRAVSIGRFPMATASVGWPTLIKLRGPTLSPVNTGRIL